MTVDSIKNGIVIDHIEAGKGMKIYRFLNLDRLTCPVALLKNVVSAQKGKKDIIKIDGALDIDLGVLGYIAPGITINIIRDGKIAEPVRGATLIGCGADVLMKIDRVGPRMWMAQGMCGSMSGSVPTNVGQPRIRISEITVGGR